MEWKLCKCLKCGLVIGTERQGSLDIFADGRCPLCGGTADWRLINDLKLVKVEQPKEVTLSNPACENCKHEKTNSWDEPCLCCEPVCNERWSKFEPKQPESVILEQIERQCKNNSEMISGLSDVGTKFIATHCEQIAHDMRKFDKRIEQLEKLSKTVQDLELWAWGKDSTKIIEQHKKAFEAAYLATFPAETSYISAKTVFEDYEKRKLDGAKLIGRCKGCKHWKATDSNGFCEIDTGDEVGSDDPEFGCIYWKAKP